jgi:amino acid transporter
MDELELLKKDWQKEDSKYPKLSYDEIYKMILKKSSSIVKWIFIISLLEFVFWTLISFGLKDTESMKRFEEYDADLVLIPLSVLGYIILAYFFYLFFKNYKTISATDTAKRLMENILKTRRTVKYYVAFNLIYLVIATIAVLFIEFDQDQQLIGKLNEASANGDVFKLYATIIISVFVVLAVFIAVLLLFYYLIYGLLLKKLNRNYKELKKMEV